MPVLFVGGFRTKNYNCGKFCPVLKDCACTCLPMAVTGCQAKRGQLNTPTLPSYTATFSEQDLPPVKHPIIEDVFQNKGRCMTETKTSYFFTLPMLLFRRDIYIPSIATWYPRTRLLAANFVSVGVFFYYSINFNLQLNILILTHIHLRRLNHQPI
jgi:hypothetical protein